jgi:hypothetical protein
MLTAMEVVMNTASVVKEVAAVVAKATVVVDPTTVVATEVLMVPKGDKHGSKSELLLTMACT